MTSFIDIYSRAMTFLKSPVLSRLQKNDLYSFCIVMNQYLNTAIVLYNPNKETSNRLSQKTDIHNDSEEFVGDGLSTSFVFSSALPPTDDSILKVTVNGDIVETYSYDATNHSIIFQTAPIVNSKIDVLWMDDGSFSDITNEDVTLLAMAMCWAWAIQTQNNQLDIDRQPNDSDFRLHSEGITLNAKIDWVKHYEEMFKRELSKADWRPFFRKGR